MNTKSASIQWSDPAKAAASAQELPGSTPSGLRVWPKMIITGSSQPEPATPPQAEPHAFSSSGLPYAPPVTITQVSSTREDIVNALASARNWGMLEIFIVLALVALTVWLVLAMRQVRDEKGDVLKTRVRDMRNTLAGEDLRDRPAVTKYTVKKGFSARKI